MEGIESKRKLKHTNVTRNMMYVTTVLGPVIGDYARRHSMARALILRKLGPGELLEVGSRPTVMEAMRLAEDYKTRFGGDYEIREVESEATADLGNKAAGQ
jgi:hypothetical protein